jgi:hypothetical protein
MYRFFAKTVKVFLRKLGKQVQHAFIVLYVVPYVLLQKQSTKALLLLVAKGE